MCFYNNTLNKYCVSDYCGHFISLLCLLICIWQWKREKDRSRAPAEAICISSQLPSDFVESVVFTKCVSRPTLFSYVVLFSFNYTFPDKDWQLASILAPLPSTMCSFVVGIWMQVLVYTLLLQLQTAKVQGFDPVSQKLQRLNEQVSPLLPILQIIYSSTYCSIINSHFYLPLHACGLF